VDLDKNLIGTGSCLHGTQGKNDVGGFRIEQNEKEILEDVGE